MLYGSRECTSSLKLEAWFMLQVSITVCIPVSKGFCVLSVGYCLT